MVRSVANYTHRQGLRSSTYLTFVVPRTRTRLGERAFSVCGPLAWNALPATIRNTTNSKPFKRLLNLHFYNGSFNITALALVSLNTLLNDVVLYISVHQLTSLM